MSVRIRIGSGVLALATAVIGLPLAAAPADAALIGPAIIQAQPVPEHSGLVPQVPRKNTPRISNGEIWDIEVVGSRVFIAGSFTSLANTISPTTTINQRFLAAYNINTGLIDTTFRPTFNGGVSAVEASPDGTKLFVGGTFSTVNGVARQKVASLNLTTGAPVTGFATTRNTNNQVTALAATNSTLYVGGKFTRVNGVLRTGLAALNTSTGAVDAGFDNNISGGVGVNGVLTVQQLKLTHDDSKLLVVHTGRQIDGQNRYGVGLIDTQSKELLPWRTTLWEEYLPVVGGVQRIYAGDIAPDDSYFVVGSGSGGDRPPINDTAIAFSLDGGDNQEPLWVSRAFDSIYSIAITETSVYVGGHFAFLESPTANQPWPGLDNVGYGWGQGLSGYALGDQVVRREHIGALNPEDGTALEWNPGSNSFEGNKAMEATPRGLFIGGDGMFQGGVRTGRVAFYDFNTVPAPSTTDTTITTPIEGRVVTSGQQFVIQGDAIAPGGNIRRVQVEIQDRDSKQFLQDNLTTWGGSNSINAALGTRVNNTTPWSLPVTIVGNRDLQIKAKTFGATTSDATKALKKIESFGFDDQTPTTSITGPATLQTSTSFTMTGTAQDDRGIDSLSYWFRDQNQNYLQDDGTVAPIFNSFFGRPDVVGATSATWSYDVTLPAEGIWRLSATARDTAGQADLRSAVRDIRVDSNAVAPTVTITEPVAMTPPFGVGSVVLAPGSPVSFAGTASDDEALRNVEITLRNTTTGENLGADGTWGAGVTAGAHRVMPIGLNQASYNWRYTTPFNLTPGSYTFTVRATDNDDLTTSSTNRGSLTLSVQIPGDSPPDGLIATGGTIAVTDPAINLTGTATDDKGVADVQVRIFDNDSRRYLQDNGSLAAGYNTLTATLANANGTSTNWSLPITLPGAGDYSVTVLAYDTAGQQDLSTAGATARYRYYPGDLPPTFEAALGQPVDGTVFTEGRIVVSGRAVDDVAMQRVQVGIVDSAGRYMSGTGTFTSTTASWRTAFLNSPGSPGSNFSYTTPVVPAGTYSVLVQATDNNDQISEIRTSTGVTVSLPPNNPPVAAATVTCEQNVCSFDGRGSTDENPTSLVYSWNYGTNQGTGSGPIPVKTYTAPATYTVTLTVRDEWNATATTTLTVTIAEPSGNVAPVPTFAFNCIALTCTTSSTGTVDPNLGDVITYTWNWGDGSPNTTGATGTRTYASPGTYTVTLTATDGWGKSASATRTVTMTEPTTNRAPNATFTVNCTERTCVTNSFGTSDPDGDQIRYAWSFGDGTTSTAASPTKTYSAAGTYTIALTVTDGWNKSTVTTRSVTVN